MCGYCTENMALQIAAHQRESGGLPEGMTNYYHFAVAQEADHLLTDPCYEEFLDAYAVGADGELHPYAASLLLTRKIISQHMGSVDYTPRAKFWLSKSEQLMGFSSGEMFVKYSADLLEQRFLLLREYIECCITPAIDNSAADISAKESPYFDVLAHLPALVDAISWLSCDLSSENEQKLLLKLAAGYLRSGVPDFCSVDLWLQRFAMCALWRRYGMAAMKKLVRGHARPFLFLYLHEREGLSSSDCTALAGLLEKEGHYDSPLDKYE